MSASREKIRRKEFASTQTGGAAEQKTAGSPLKKVFAVLGIVLAVCVVVFFTLMMTGFFATHSTAAVASGHKLTPATVNYFYRTSYQNMAKQYGDYLSMFLDPNKSLSQQYFDEESGRTWADYLIDQGLDSAAAIYAVKDEAVRNGFTLSESDKSYIDAMISSLQTSAAAQGVSVNAYLASMYGTGCNLKSYRSYLEDSMLVSSYDQSISDSFTYTDEQIAAEYEADPDSYDTVTYRLYPITDSTFGDVEDVKDLEGMKQTMASEMADQSSGDEAAFIRLAEENAPESTKETYVDESATLHANVSKASTPAALADWLFEAARAEGDTTYVSTDTGTYYVAYFLSRQDNDIYLPTVRHILISVAADADDAADAAAKEKAEDLLDLFNSTDPSAESFAQLAIANSEDTGTASNGGLCENVAPGQMVAEFSDWCFDESRQPGDTGIVRTSYGYHVIYFDHLSEETYRHMLVEDALHSADYNAWATEATKDASVEKNAFGMRFVTK